VYFFDRTTHNLPDKELRCCVSAAFGKFSFNGNIFCKMPSLRCRNFHLSKEKELFAASEHRCFKLQGFQWMRIESDLDSIATLFAVFRISQYKSSAVQYDNPAALIQISGQNMLSCHEYIDHIYKCINASSKQSFLSTTRIARLKFSLSLRLFIG
jgi:hypothetical protein